MFTFLVEHFASVVGFVLAVGLLSRELRAQRPASVTIAWLLAIVLAPYVGVPLYLVFGGRKMARRAASKGRLPRAETPAAADAPASQVDKLLDGMGVAPATHDNRLTLLARGEDAFDAMLDLFDGAEVSIHVTTFILGGDAVGNALVDRLVARARAGVEVRLLLDALFARRADTRRLDELRRAGGKVAFFMPFFHVPFRGHANLRNHRKIAVADGSRAVVGGMNLAEEYMGPTPLAGRWRDLSVRIEGSAARDLDAVFVADWEFAAGEEATTDTPTLTAAKGSEGRDGELGARSHGGPDAASPVRVVPSGPDAATDSLYDLLLSAVFAAEKRIWIATPYFVPDDPLVRALILACRRGVDVLVVVPVRSNHVSADLAGGPSLRAVEDAGGRVRPFIPGMLHAKAYLVDDHLAVVGSANFDMRSLFLNYEIGVFLRAEGDVARLGAWFESLLEDCAERAPTPGRLRAAAEDVARLVGPLV